MMAAIPSPSWLYSITFLLLVFALLYKYATRNFNYWKKRNVHYIKPTLLFGNLLPLLGLKQILGEWLRDLCHQIDQINQDYFGIFLFDQPVLVVQSPKMIKAILQKDFSYFQDRAAVHPERDPIMSNILFFNNNPKWKTMRAKLSPIFTSGKLKMMFSVFLEEGKAMADYIEGIANVPNVESKEICAKYSTNVIAKCAFAVEAKSFENEDAEFRKLGRRMFEFKLSNAFRQIGPWLTPNMIKLFDVGFFEPQIVGRLFEIFTEVLHRRRASAFLKGQDLVDIMIEAQKNDNAVYGDHALVGQAIQFFAGGFETVSGSLSFTLYELCIHPDIQDKLRMEILDHLKTHDNAITYEGLSEMKYMDMCVSETLRKYPVLPFLDRLCQSDYKLPGSDLTIEKGTPVYIPTWALHYDPKIYPDPNKYDPERFADKNNINTDGLSYVPFGEGPRICIGNRFGLIGVKMGLAAIIPKFKLEATEKTPIPIKFSTKSMLLQSDVGVPLKFVPL